eukprot:COSAG06_NODE_12798_length_1327_cov_1.315961_1_plen_325_part_00
MPTLIGRHSVATENEVLKNHICDSRATFAPSHNCVPRPVVAKLSGSRYNGCLTDSAPALARVRLCKVRHSSAMHLEYFLKEDLKQKKVLKGHIDLTEPDCKVFVLPNDLQDKCRQSFGISTKQGGKDRIYYLMAGDRKMMTKWVGRLQRECKMWQENGGKRAPEPSKGGDDVDGDVEEGVPPEVTAEQVDEMVAATMKANELLAQLSEGEPSAELKQQAEKASDELLAGAKTAMKALDYAKATLSLKLAIKLDPENMEAEKLMKQAMSKMAAMDGELKEGVEQKQKRAADGQKKKAAAKPLKKISMFDDDDDDDDDDGGGLFGD